MKTLAAKLTPSHTVIINIRAHADARTGLLSWAGIRHQRQQTSLETRDPLYVKLCEMQQVWRKPVRGIGLAIIYACGTLGRYENASESLLCLCRE